MTRKEIRDHIRTSILNESVEGFWTDSELNDHIQFASNRVATLSLDTKADYQATTINGVQAYELPDDFLDVDTVFHDDGNRPLQLTNPPIGELLNTTTTGRPTGFVIDGDLIYLEPTPDQSDIGNYNDTTLLDTHQELDANAGIGQTFQISGTVAENIENARLYLRKIGNALGQIYLEIVSGATTIGESAHVDVEALEVFYQWFSFTWQFPPYVEPSTTYSLRLRGDADYIAAFVAGQTSIVWGVDGSSPTYTSGNLETYDGVSWTADATKDALFEVYPLKNDLLVKYFTAETAKMEKDTDSPENPTRNHQAIVHLAASYALNKNGYDTAQADRHEARGEALALAGRTRTMRQRGQGGHSQTGTSIRQGSIVINNP